MDMKWHHFLNSHSFHRMEKHDLKRRFSLFWLHWLALSSLLLLTQCDLLFKKTIQPTSTPATLTLPPNTQSGEGTIGFRVNGDIWLPYASFNFPRYVAYYKNRTFWFSGNRVERDKATSFSVHIHGFDATTTTYDLLERSEFSGKGDGRTVHAGYSEDASGVSSFVDSYVVQQVNKSQLHITRLDTVQRIMAGTFECELVSPTSGKTMQITDGRFDIAY